MKRSYAPVEILVCQAGACRSKGSEAVLLEIEELAKGLGDCVVQPSGCLGECSRAPNAVVVRQRGEKMFTKIHDLEKSSAVVKEATGIMPSLDDPSVVQRLTDVRQMRIRQQARDESKWNTALSGFAEKMSNKSGNELLQLKFEYCELLQSACCWEQALEEITEVEKYAPRNVQVLMDRAKILGKLGQFEEIDQIKERVSKIFCDPEDFRAELQVSSFLAKCRKVDDYFYGSERRIENYGQWHLESVTKVSKHSAIYHFMSKDRLRNTPNPRGRGRTVWHKTWHTTMLAKVGANTEGPLMWIERDYTPISTAKDWEKGKCDILIKIYDTGLATSWLYKQPLNNTIWLSKPSKTLDVPSLVPDLTEAAFKPASYLLILAGSGIVAAPQVLHHTDPATCFGSFPVLKSPISLIYSCRQDDVCMVNDMVDWCKGAKLQHCTLVLTEPQAGMVVPFPEVDDASLTDFESLENTAVVRSRISRELLDSEVKSLKNPCRIVVSGPASFNSAVKDMLRQNGIGLEAITVLSAG